MDINFGSYSVIIDPLAMVGLLINIAIIVLAIVFIVKSVKYFKRLEKTINEINLKMGFHMDDSYTYANIASKEIDTRSNSL